MAKENRSKFAILGVLLWGPMSGYDIKKWFESSISNFWNESYGQIYPILKELVQEGFAVKNIHEQSGKPDRYTYELTERGRESLQEWLRRPAVQEAGRIEILLKLYMGRHLSTADSIRLVQQYLDEQRQIYKQLQHFEHELKRLQVQNDLDAPFWIMTVRYGLLTTQSRLRWCDETILSLSQTERPSEATVATFKPSSMPNLRNDPFLARLGIVQPMQLGLS